MRRRRETVGTPPLRQMSWIGERREHQLARVEQPAADDRAQIRIQIDAIFFAHASFPPPAVF